MKTDTKITDLIIQGRSKFLRNGLEPTALYLGKAEREALTKDLKKYNEFRVALSREKGSEVSPQIPEEKFFGMTVHEVNAPSHFAIA